MLECGQGFFVVAQPFNITIEELQVYLSLIFAYHINYEESHNMS
jgi:predicted nuclease of restriction endonuclease-like (RecB) superfamily